MEISQRNKILILALIICFSVFLIYRSRPSQRIDSTGWTCLNHPEKCYRPTSVPSRPIPAVEIGRFRRLGNKNTKKPITAETPLNISYLLQIRNVLTIEDVENPPTFNITIIPKEAVEVPNTSTEDDFRGNKISSEFSVKEGGCEGDVKCSSRFYPGMGRVYIIDYKIKESPESGEYLKNSVHVRYPIETTYQIEGKVVKSQNIFGKDLDPEISYSKTLVGALSLEASFEQDSDWENFLDTLFGIFYDNRDNTTMLFSLKNKREGYIKADDIHDIQIKSENFQIGNRKLNLTKEFREKLQNKDAGLLESGERAVISREIETDKILKNSSDRNFEFSGKLNYTYTLVKEDYIKSL